jgi:hypothetical protein
MILEGLRIIGAIILLLFLPGFFFIQALFPKKNELDESDDFLYRIILSIALSIVISILIGFALGSLGINPSTGKGYFDTPFIIASLGLFSLVMFFIALYRGAFPKLIRNKRQEEELLISEDERQDFYKIMDRWRELKEKLNRLEIRIEEEPVSNRGELKGKRDRLLKQFNKLDEKLKSLGIKSKEIKTDAKKLHVLINEWKNLKMELHQCEKRIEICKGEQLKRNLDIRDELKKKIAETEENISFLKGDSE